MKIQNNRAFIVVVLALVVISSLLYTSLVSEKPKPRKYHVSVVVDNSIDERWSRFQAGIDQAAKEYNVTLSYVTTHQFESIDEEMNVIRQEVNNGAQGLILQFVESENTTAFVDELINRTSISMIQTDVKKNVDLQGRYATILPDYDLMGKKLAKMLYDQDPDNFVNQHIGLVTGKCLDHASIELLKSFQKEIEHLHGAIGWTCEQANSIEMLQMEHYCSRIVALDDLSLTEASKHIYEDFNGTPLLFGVGYSDRNLKLIEDGKIQEMLVVNEYSVGYLALSTLMDHLENPGSKMENKVVNTIVVSKKNLFSKEYESILFPISQ